jgi:hypothetical protein
MPRPRRPAATAAATMPRLERSVSVIGACPYAVGGGAAWPPDCAGRLRLGETEEELLEGVPGEVPRVELEDAGASHGASGHQAVELQALEGLLHAGQRSAEHARELPRVALPEEGEGEEHAGARAAAEGAGALDDHR